MKPTAHAAPLRARMRHGAGPWAASALCASLLAITLTSWGRASLAAADPLPRRGDWVAMGARISDCVHLVGVPIASAAACLQGSLHARSGTRWLGQSAARSRLARTLLDTAPAVLWPLAGYATAATVLYVHTALYTPRGAPSFAPLAHDLARLAAYACLAYGLGRLLPHRFGVPLAAVGAAFAETFVVDQGLWINFTDGVYVGPAIPQYAAWRFTEATGRLLLLAALFAAVAALAVLVDARRWRWASALAPVIAAGVVWAGAAAPVYRSDHDPRAAFPVHCSGHKPVMCWSGDGDRPPAQLTAVARHLDGRLRGVENAPTHYADVTEVTSDDESGYAPHESEPGHTAMVSLYPDRESTFRDTVDALVGRRTDDTATPSHRPADALAQWLLPPDLRAPAYRRDVRRIDSLSAAARTAWLGHCLDVADHGGPLPPLPLLPPSSTKATEP